MISRVLGKWGRWAAWVVAVLAVPVALALVVIATDLLRTPGQITADDARFESAPMRQGGLWDVGFLPRNLSEKLLGLEDDVLHRQILGYTSGSSRARWTTKASPSSSRSGRRRSTRPRD